jgi:membrane protein involved in colicin uptake
VNIDNRTEINLFNDEEWAALINKITPVIEERKKAILEKQIAEAEAQKQKEIEAALQEERDRVAKEKAAAELKEQQEKIRKEMELMQGKDKERYADIIRQFNALVIHEMNSPMYKNKVSVIKEKIEEILSL